MNVTEISKSVITLHVVFRDPQLISTGGINYLDSLEVTITKPEVLKFHDVAVVNPATKDSIMMTPELPRFLLNRSTEIPQQIDMSRKLNFVII